MILKMKMLSFMHLLVVIAVAADDNDADENYYAADDYDAVVDDISEGTSKL